ncbi:MAG: hypothetical protein JNM26_17235, partial [Ideonella sp.]|nr:hypothetical protein [Ideonella sp.]
VCSYEPRYKIQRLAFAWRKSLGSAAGACQDFRELSLPHLPPKDQVRPGYSLTLTVGGKRIRVLTLHLKSACVSPLDGRGRLDGNTRPDDPCLVLQQQVAPLEEILEDLPKGVDHVVVLGDFNRNLPHEARVAGAEPVRSDGSTDLRRPRPQGVATRNLLAEVNDGQPPASALALLSPTCTGSADITAACDRAKTQVLTADERRILTDRTGLGCRNPVGLVHILVSDELAKSVLSTTKVPLGNFGRSLSARPPQNPEPLLAVSDHCPVVTEIDL